MIYCGESVDFEQPELLACAGLPALRHLYLLQLPQRNRRRQLVAPGLLHQVETLGFYFRNDMVRSGSWAALGLDAASLDKTLFDCASSRVDFFAQPVAGPRHLRLYDFYRSDQYSVVARQYADLARHLAAGNLPDLKTLYLSGTLDVSHVMLPRKLADAIRPVLAQCVTASVAVVFEDGFVTRVANGEERFSPHFEARCQRVRAEKKAARVPELR
ncbi:hypothetical protein DMC30DRAFT_389502 [Rhodotorula diobovata]|uniref:Uncharacterized protein n=1 Tax=Rhodotorula diobovata TaxID=5288 RepID=A0A5C5G3A5_9BASI|nr:hypothetical protein DMC30DRAFT_389502 [Rhodotorula diobovata]